MIDTILVNCAPKQFMCNMTFEDVLLVQLVEVDLDNRTKLKISVKNSVITLVLTEVFELIYHFVMLNLLPLYCQAVSLASVSN